MEKPARVPRLVFSLLLSAAAVFGLHLHIVSPYDGRMDENYITPFAWPDLLLLALLTALFTLLLGLLFRALGRGKKGLHAGGPCLAGQGLRFVLILLLLFLLWLPYLLRYCPGFLFQDSLNSLQQAMGLLPLNNRNPILFTLFLRLCLRLAGDLTAACLLYTVFQMLCMAAAFSYLICWLRARARLGRGWLLLLIALYGLNPYTAADSIALWKDPLFSAALVVWSLLLADLALSRGQAASRRSWLLSFSLLTVILLFWRNNGFCSVLAAALFLLVPALRRRGGFRRALLLCAAGLLLWAVVTVPVYRHFGIGTPKEESGGMLLNQMARVAAYGGEMSEEERAYLDELLPLEAYPEAYRPCCVDLLKWDERFDYSALAGSRFLRTWVGLGLKNPRLYLEAWAMESYGFWTLTRPEILLNTANISAGAPLNPPGDGEVPVGDTAIRFHNYLGQGLLSRLLPTDIWSLPLGPLNWFVLLTGLFLLLCGKRRLLLPLAPSLGVMLGLLAATPIWYLPRYEAGVQFLAPLFLLLLLRGKES